LNDNFPIHHDFSPEETNENNEIENEENKSEEHNSSIYNESESKTDRDIHEKPMMEEDFNHEMVDVIDDLDNFKISDENNFKMNHVTEQNHSIIGKRRHIFDSSYINNKKAKDIQYIFNKSTKRKNTEIKETSFNKKPKVENNDNYINEENNQEYKEILNVSMDIPVTYNQAVTCKLKDEWKSAIEDELKNLYDNHIIKFVKKLSNNKKSKPNGFLT